MTSLKNLLKSPPYVATAVVVVVHDVDPRVRYYAEVAENVFRPVVSTNAVSTNAPEGAPPGAPRLLLRQGHKTIALSSDRAQLAMEFQHDRVSVPDALAVIKKNAELFVDCVSRYRTGEFSELGFVVELNFLSGSSSGELMSALADSIYGGVRLGKLVSLDMKIGFQNEEAVYKTLILAQYEVREQFLEAGMPRKIHYSSMPVVERGLSVKLDTNNRGRLANALPLEKLIQEFGVVRSAMDELIREYPQVTGL